MTTLTRRTFATALALAAGLSANAAFAAGKELHVLNWQGYGTDERGADKPWALDAFEKKTGIKVLHDYYTSEDEMMTKLRTAPGVYDVVLMNNTYVMKAEKEGLIQPIDEKKIGNFGDLSPSLRDSDRFVKDGKHYAVSWVWGVTSFAINTDKIKPAPDSIEAIWDPKYKGKVGFRDDAMEAVQLAALATGQDMNNPTDMGKIKDKLKALGPQLKTLWSSEDEWNKHLQAGDYDIASFWSGSAARSKKAFKLPVGFIIPKEGAIGWFDGLTVAAKAPNPDGAHAFIDFMVSPDFYVPWDNTIGAPASANAKANAMLPEDALNRAVLSNPDVMKRLHFMAPTSDETKNKYNELWNEVKTGFAQ